MAQLFFTETELSESDYSGLLDAELDLCGTVVFKCVGSSWQGSGWPDRHYSHRLWVGWIEWKGPKNHVSQMQRQRIIKLNRAGDPAFVGRYLPVERVIRIGLLDESRCMTFNMAGVRCRNPNNSARDLTLPAWGVKLLEQLAIFTREVKREAT